MEEQMCSQCSICWKYFETTHNYNSSDSTVNNMEVYKQYIQQDPEFCDTGTPIGPSQKERRKRKKRKCISKFECVMCTESCKKISDIQNAIEELQKELNKVILLFREEIERCRKKKNFYQNEICDPLTINNHEYSPLAENDSFSDPEDQPCDGINNYLMKTGNVEDNCIVGTDLCRSKKSKNQIQRHCTASNSKSKCSSNTLRGDIVIKEEYIDEDDCNSFVETRDNGTQQDSSVLTLTKTKILTDIPAEIPTKFKSKNIRDIRVKIEKIEANLLLEEVGLHTGTKGTLKRKAALVAKSVLFRNQGSIDSDDSSSSENIRNTDKDSEYVASEEEAFERDTSKRNLKPKASKCALAKVDENDVVFFCDLCQMTLDSVSMYIYHVQSHGEALDKLLYCPVCKDGGNFCTASAGSFRNHMKKHTVQLKCLYCSQEFSKRPALNRHQIRCVEEYHISCDIENCIRRFKSVDALEKHKESHSQEILKKKYSNSGKYKPRIKIEHKCEPCGLTFRFLSVLVEHLKTHPGGSDTDTHISCPLCGKQFGLGSVQSAFKYHMIGHYGATPYKCNDCELSFGTPFELNVHRINHTNAYQFSCDLPKCGKKFKLILELQCHKENHPEPNKAEVYKCEICGDVYEPTTKTVLESHAVAAHEGYKPFKCTIENCEKRFSTENLMQLHVQSTHTKSQTYPCKKCGNVYYILRALKRHEKDIHGENLYICEMCGKVHTRKEALKQHILTHHNQSEKKCVCEECGKRYTTNYKLSVHIKHSHRKEYDFKCEFCDATFQGKRALVEHVRNLLLEHRSSLFIYSVDNMPKKPRNFL